MEIRYKSKPLNYKRQLQRFAMSAICAVIFALVLFFMVYLFRKPLQEMLGVNGDNRIVFEAGESKSGQTQSEQNQDGNQVIMENQRITEAFYDAAVKANKFLVGINEVSAEGYGGKKTYSDDACGIVMCKTEKALLILSSSNAIRGTNIVQVTFFNGQTAAGEVGNIDQETGIAVVSVPLKSLDKDTKRNVTVAKFGKSYALKRGEYTVAIGNPLRENRSMAVGQFMSVTGKSRMTDREYTVLETNILGRRHSAGFLVDINSNVTGIITHREDDERENYTIKALGISDLSDLVDALTNNKEVPFMGVMMSTVTRSTARAYDIPEGAYVEYVYLHSPAVNAGIQKGDILVALGKREIKSTKYFTEALMELSPGTRVKVQFMRFTGGTYKRMSAEVLISSK